jgi:WYL domain
MTSTFENLVENESLSQAERLAFIDFRLRYLGEIARSDLIDEFKIGQATASNDLKRYKVLRPENTDRNNTSRTTIAMDSSFSPLIGLSVHTALNFILHGFCRNELLTRPSYLPAGSIDALMTTDTLQEENVVAITRAIHSQSGIQCCYLSSSSENHDERLLFPTAIFVDRGHWYFRAYDRNTKAESCGFKNFKMARIKSAIQLPQDKPSFHECMSQDEAWHTLLPLQLAIHSECQNKSSLAKEFGFVDGKKTLVCKAAFAYIVKKSWHIDVGDGGNSFYHFILENSESLRQIKCADNLFK